MKSPRLLLFGPLAVIQAYLLVTVLLFSVSAWSYPVHRPVLFYGYLVAAQLALFLGYRWTVTRPALGYRGWPSIATLARAAIGINLILLVPTALFRTGGALDLVAALTDPGAAYTQSLDARAGMNPVVEYFRIIAGPLLACLYPITVLYWSRLSPLARALAVLALLGTVLTFIAMGTNKAIVDTAVLFPWLLAAAHFSRQFTLTRKSALSIAAVALLALAGATAFFGRTMAMRTGSVAAYGYFGLAGLRANDQALHVRYLPPDVRIAVLGLDFYLTHGYYALSMSLDEPFVPCWGVGNSYFLVRNAARILRDESIASCPYPVRIEKYGWDAEKVWSSIYPWLASDFTFPGSLLVIFFVGAGFGAAWRDTLRGANPFAVALFAQLVIMLLYFPANNQQLQSGEGLTAFFGILVAWYATRMREPVDAPAGALGA